MDGFICFLTVADYLLFAFLVFNFMKTMTETPQEPEKAN